MLEAMKKFQAGNLLEIDKNKTFPLMRWLSGSPENLLVCEKANKMFFKVKPEIILSYLYLNKKNKSFIRYPKKSKSNNEALEILRPYIKKMYQWSDRDIEKNKIVVERLVEDEKFINHINNTIGLEKADAKKFGVDKKIEKQIFSKRKDLFMFT